MLTATQREHLIYTFTGQIAVICFGIGWLFYYVFPSYTTIAASTEAANKSIEQYDHTLSDGVTVADIDRIIGTDVRYEELRKIIAADSVQVESVIKKPSSESREYTKWLGSSLVASADEEKRVQQAKAAINSILPTLSSLWGGDMQEETLSLRKFITFMERKIFKAYDLPATQPLWFQSVSFGADSSLPENVGYMEFSVTLEDTSDKIFDLIRQINDTGNPKSILSGTGKAPQILANPLFVIKDLSLQDFPDALQPGEKNSGNMTIRFYLRWGGDRSMRVFQDQLVARLGELSKLVEDQQLKCNGNTWLCREKKTLDDLAKNIAIIQEGINSTIQDQWGTAPAAMISQFYTTVDNLEKEVKKIK